MSRRDPAKTAALAARGVRRDRRRVRPVPPMVIAHRGASAYRPEHTLAGYRLAITQGADYLEPDLVSTKDGVLVCRHENEISQTTDVATRPEFAARRTTKRIDDREVTGWFTEDFTWAELRSLRAIERLPDLRPENTRYDGQFHVPSFAEVLALANRESLRGGRMIGIYPETKHPAHFAALGLGLERPLLAALRAGRRDHPQSRVLIQSFDPTNLRWLRRHTGLRLVQLVDQDAAHLVDPDGLREVARYADAVGVHKDLVLPRDPLGQLRAASTLVDRAHELGLQVHSWTARPENAFLPTELRSPGGAPAEHGDLSSELLAHFEAGVDGVFCDAPDQAVLARTAWLDATLAARA